MQNSIKSLVDGVKKLIDESYSIPEIKETTIEFLGLNLDNKEREIYYNDIYRGLNLNPEDITEVKAVNKKIIDKFVEEYIKWQK